MKATRLALTSILIAFAALHLAACGGRKTTVQTSNTTMGQELSDLQDAYNEGIITEKEFKRAKKDILDKYE